MYLLRNRKVLILYEQLCACVTTRGERGIPLSSFTVSSFLRCSHFENVDAFYMSLIEVCNLIVHVRAVLGHGCPKLWTIIVCAASLVVWSLSDHYSSLLKQLLVTQRRYTHVYDDFSTLFSHIPNKLHPWSRIPLILRFRTRSRLLFPDIAHKIFSFQLFLELVQFWLDSSGFGSKCQNRKTDSCLTFGPWVFISLYNAPECTRSK